LFIMGRIAWESRLSSGPAGDISAIPRDSAR